MKLGYSEIHLNSVNMWLSGASVSSGINRKPISIAEYYKWQVARKPEKSIDWKWNI